MHVVYTFSWNVHVAMTKDSWITNQFMQQWLCGQIDLPTNLLCQQGKRK